MVWPIEIVIDIHIVVASCEHGFQCAWCTCTYECHTEWLNRCVRTVAARHEARSDITHVQIVRFEVFDRRVRGYALAVLKRVLSPLGHVERSDTLQCRAVDEMGIAARIIAEVAAVTAALTEFSMPVALRSCNSDITKHGHTLDIAIRHKHVNMGGFWSRGTTTVVPCC